MRTGTVILGGAFDPPTAGHACGLKAAFQTERYEKAVLLPCFEHNFGKKLSPVHLRVKWCEETLRYYMPHGEVCLFEVERQLKGNTLDVLRLLRESKQLPEPLTFLIGEDNARAIERWYKWRDLITEFNFHVIQRGTEPYSTGKNGAWASKPPHYYQTGEVSEVSSTHVRLQCKLGKPLQGLVAPGIESEVGSMFGAKP